MTSPFVDSILPVQETVAHKTENLDWANIPSGPCELEFRPALEITFREHWAALVFFGLASALAVPLAWCLGRFLAPHISGLGYAVALAIAGILLAAVHELRRRDASSDAPPKLLAAATVFYFAAPLFVWLTLLMTGHLAEPVGAFVFLFVVAVPIVIIIADQIATHAIYWLTASTQVDYATKVAWREDWRGRFLADPSVTVSEELADDVPSQRQFAAVCRARASYFTGPIWLAAAFLVPDFILLAATSDPNPGTIGLQLLLGSLLGLSLVVLIRTGGRRAMVMRVGEAILHWLHYGNRGPMPPWVFQSPLGGLWRRRAIAAVAVGLLAAAMGHLGGKSTLFLLFTPAESPATTTVTQPTSIHPREPQPDDVWAWNASQWFWLAVTVVCYSLLPLTIFFWSSVVVVGPILFAYHNALEN